MSVEKQAVEKETATPSAAARDLAEITKLDVNIVTAAGWSEGKMTEAFNTCSAAQRAAARANRVSLAASGVSLAGLGLMFVNMRFFTLVLAAGLTSMGAGMVGGYHEGRGKAVAEQIQRDALGRLAAPK